MAPPSTPAKPRFLPSKRKAPTSQTQTHTQISTTPFQPGALGHQFVSTPRFNNPAVPGISAHQQQQQPPIFSTPGASRARPTPRPTQYEPLIDTIDSTPSSSNPSQDASPSQDHRQDEDRNGSPSASRSPSADAERSVKRQRLSRSPQPQPSSSPEDSIADASPQPEKDLTGAIKVSDDFETTPQRRHPTVARDRPTPASEPLSPNQPAPRHPTFRDAPRFKATQAAPGASDGHPLPDAFSPQRRGAKYVPGGLAAEVRDWLVQVKGDSEYDSPAGTSLQMKVSECVQGYGVRMAMADKVDGNVNVHASKERNEDVERVILAGDGRITGLAKQQSIHAGATVSMYQPMWHVHLGNLGHFAVACDWEVQD